MSNHRSGDLDLIDSSSGCGVDFDESSLCIGGRERTDEFASERTIGNTENIGDHGFGDLLSPRVADHLIGKRQGIANRAARFASEQSNRGRFNLDFLARKNVG